MPSPYLVSTLDDAEWSASRSGRFIRREIVSATHWIGVWVGGAVLDAIQLVARRYTDWAISALWHKVGIHNLYYPWNIITMIKTTTSRRTRGRDMKYIVTCYLRSQPIRGSLLGNSFVNRNSTGAVARQRPARNNGSTVGSGVFYVVRSEAISLHRQSSEQFSEFQIRGREWSYSSEQFSC
jgi:hypothetical protein